MFKYCFIIVLIFLFGCTSKYTNNKYFNKKDSIPIVLSFINPAVGVGTIVSQANYIQKTYSVIDIAYTLNSGNSLAEEALSNTTNKKCRLTNLVENQNICID